VNIAFKRGAMHLLQSARHRLPPVAGVMARWQPVRARLAGHWQNLAPRERTQLLLMVAVLAGALLWLLFTRPALQTLRYWHDEMPRLRSQATALQAVLADVAPPATTGAQASRPAAERLSASLDQGGLAGTYSIHHTEAGWIVAVDHPTDATRLVAWLMRAPAELHLTIKQAVLERAPPTPTGQGSRITANVVFSEQPPPARNGT
jgi:general secretion pathway protein M